MSWFQFTVCCLLVGCCLFGWQAPALAAITEIEPNDTFETAVTTACGDTVLCASIDGDDLDHYRILVAAGDSLIVQTIGCDGSDFQTLLILFGPDSEVLDVDQNGGVNDFSLVRTWTQVGGWYTVRVMNLEGSGMPPEAYSLVCECRTPEPEAYDYCETARVVPQLPYYDEGDTGFLSDDTGTPAPDVFYRFTQEVESDLKVTVCSEFFDARVQIIGGCIHDFMDDASDGDCLNGATLYSFSVQPGDYYVIVEGTSLYEFGEYSIEIEPFYPECPAPGYVVLFDIGGLPSLDWPDVEEASYYLIRQAVHYDGPYSNLDTTYISFYQDPVGFAADSRFYQVITVCPWSR